MLPIAALRTQDFALDIQADLNALAKMADEDGNGWITQAEAKWLPEVFQDNYESYRKRVGGRDIISVRLFSNHFNQYAEKSIFASDVNLDGFVEETELHALPEDLRDNFWLMYNHE
jgi:hypothetical protein